uniref:Uncharacterized protein n=1 Tax=Parascaris univalens TaxID=6257 RepID=A0A915A107_PARUN
MKKIPLREEGTEQRWLYPLYAPRVLAFFFILHEPMMTIIGGMFLFSNGALLVSIHVVNKISPYIFCCIILTLQRGFCYLCRFQQRNGRDSARFGMVPLACLSRYVS